jgi:hypothetical protein
MKQPNIEQQKELNDVLENSIDYVQLGGKAHKIKWIKRYTIRRLTDVMLSDGKEDEVIAKCASLILLNGWWKINLLHRWYWKRIWHKYSDAELLRVVTLAKKKADFQVQQYLIATISLTEMKDTTMMMNRQEAEHTLQELKQAQVSQSVKSTRN